MSRNSQELYEPTVDEKLAIKIANQRFITPYGICIGMGAGLGFAIVRRLKEPWTSIRATSIIFGTSLAGEFIGRKTGERLAVEALHKNLPAESKLRQLMEQNHKLPPMGVSPSNAIPSHFPSANDNAAIQSAQPHSLFPRTREDFEKMNPSTKPKRTNAYGDIIEE